MKKLFIYFIRIRKSFTFATVLLIYRIWLFV